MRTGICFVLFIGLCFCASPPQIWIFSQHNLQVASNVQVVQNLIDTGKAAGYNGIAINDYKLTILNSGLVDPSYYNNLRTVINYATAKGFAINVGVWPFGYSDAVFQTESYNYQLAEPLLHANASFTVSSSRTLVHQPCCSGPPDGGFEIFSGNTFTKWSWQDARIVPDTTVFHSGHSSAKIVAGSGNARVVLQNYALSSWRMYHIQAWFKTSGFSGGAQIEILDSATGTARNYNNYNPASTQDWTVLDFVFNSMSSTAVGIYIGNWGGSSGTAWVDDVKIIEYAPFNVIQRDGAPFKVYNPTTHLVYSAGTDYNTYSDPATANGYLNNYHVVAPVTLPASTRLTAGSTVNIDYYGVIPAYNQQIGACLSHPNITSYMNGNVKAVSDAIPAGTGFFLGYDEMRHMHSCQLCQAAAPTAGQLLANHVTKSVNLFKNYKNASGLFPNTNSKLYFWSDMFDPNHNAVNNYYYVPTTIANSWNGLPAGAIIYNWNLQSLDTSLGWFEGRGFSQIVAGYYDSGDGRSSGQSECTIANKHTKVLGFMYTTWNNDYSQMTSYAQGILATWNPKTGSIQHITVN